MAKIIVRYRKKILFTVIISLLLLLSCDASNDRPNVRVSSNEIITDQPLETLQFIHSGTVDSDIYYFGFDLRGSPQEDAAQYLPFLKYLSDKADSYTSLRKIALRQSNLVRTSLSLPQWGHLTFFLHNRVMRLYRWCAV